MIPGASAVGLLLTGLIIVALRIQIRVKAVKWKGLAADDYLMLPVTVSLIIIGL